MHIFNSSPNPTRKNTILFLQKLSRIIVVPIKKYLPRKFLQWQVTIWNSRHSALREDMRIFNLDANFSVFQCVYVHKCVLEFVILRMPTYLKIIAVNQNKECFPNILFISFLRDHQLSRFWCGLQKLYFFFKNCIFISFWILHFGIFLDFKKKLLSGYSKFLLTLYHASPKLNYDTLNKTKKAILLSYHVYLFSHS